MLGLVPSIHAFAVVQLARGSISRLEARGHIPITSQMEGTQDVDARDKPEHDG